jgi:long-chain acyl-CoA synthetase
MGYLHTDDPPRGEVLYSGSNVFSGYFRAPDKTKETFDEDGWLCTGDVGVILPNGSLKIIDRAKNIFKLSQGEYVAPEKLENIYVQSQLIAQIFVYGDSLQCFLIAVIIIDPENAKDWAKKKGVDPEDMESLVKNADLRKDIFAQIEEKGKENKVTGLEKIKKAHFTFDPFSVENGILTPTFKLKRNEAKKAYEAELNALYAEGL